MLWVQKKQGKTADAYRLGEDSPFLEELVRCGKIVPLGDGRFEVMSQEATAGRSGHGELAAAGDFIKLDNAGFPYPVGEKWFLENHEHVEGTRYRQVPRPLRAWTYGEAMCPEVAFLIREKGLVLCEEEPERYFSAPLRGTWEAAPRDAVLVFYRVTYAAGGSVSDAEYNFVARDEFIRTYDIPDGPAGR